MNRPSTRLSKRFLDVTISATALVALSPLLVVSAALVRWRLGSPVLFRQQRIGLGDRPFGILKLRTMTDERDSEGTLLADDLRVTRLGRFLRNTSIDELPALANVLFGQMSLVGPRPLPTRYLPRYTSEQRRRHQVLPGITGLAQVRGRNRLSWEDKFRWDIEYVDNQSMRLDLVILSLTVSKVLRRTDIDSEHCVSAPEFLGGEHTKAHEQQPQRAA
ncbi:MAG: sugar transferase [Planctomycetota bacterium]